MATNDYNGVPADTETVCAGTLLYRILPTTAPYAANSIYDPAIPLPVGDPLQGRFDPSDPTFGGYLYVAQSVEGAVAEGILRRRPVGVPPTVQKSWLTGPKSQGGKKLATMQLDEDLEIAALYGRHTAKLNLSATLLTGEDYSATRVIGSAVLTASPSARGMKYRCANHDDLTSLMLIGRGGAPVLTLVDEVDIFYDDAGRDLVLRVLRDEFGLSYHGTAGNRDFRSPRR
ncbi:RES family NAD+ phosphorylase [Rhodococcus sp. BS-15]|uniref:RES family NAD+ phosphorylase n=1 Tax=Rhodococcus sp. BS-15 TaxID=1304954 RepID=UPI001650F9AD|nr:RES family NAD+ phosphorylase [Rhodococcus sp. BS-15]